MAAPCPDLSLDKIIGAFVQLLVAGSYISVDDKNSEPL